MMENCRVALHTAKCAPCVTTERARRGCFTVSSRDEPPCGAEDFLICFEYRGFSHISNHNALIADKHHGAHRIKLICFCSQTIS